jgi:hypothetical protein
MQVTGVAIVGGQTVVTCTKPTTTAGEYLFNSPYPIADGENGWAYKFGVVIALGNGTPPTAPNVIYQPVVSTWTIEEGGSLFTVFGEHNVIANAVVGRFTGGGSRHLQVILSADLFAAVNTKRDPSTATARILRRLSNGDLSLSADTITIVYRFMHISVDAGTYAKAEWIDGEWQLYAADCATGSSSGP